MSTIAVRVDASVQLGIGHVMRCITLTRMLVQALDTSITFVCNDDLPAEMAEMIQQYGYRLRRIAVPKDESAYSWEQDAEQTIACLSEQSIDWLIVDHYQLDQHWERELRPYTDHILVIDDLANRVHDCDALLDQNLHPSMYSRYEALVKPDCRLFIGPAYILLRPEFVKYREHRQSVERCRHILINFGGSDPTHETERLVQLLGRLSFEDAMPTFHIVAGPANARREQVKQLCSDMPQIIYYDQANMAELLVHTDLAIGAGGITMWERCFMGVPSAVIIVADNQIESVQEAERLELIWNLGKSNEVDEERLIRFLTEAIQHVEMLQQQQQHCMNFIPDRKQGLHPVVEYIKGEL